MNDPNEERRPEVRHEVSSGSNGQSPKLIAVGVLAIAVFIFAIANDDPVKISFGFFNWDTTIRWSIFIAVLLGIALDRLLIWALGRRRESKRKKDE